MDRQEETVRPGIAGESRIGDREKQNLTSLQTLVSAAAERSTREYPQNQVHVRSAAVTCSRIEYGYWHSPRLIFVSATT